MDDADEHKEGEEDLLDIMHVDGESLDKDESSNKDDESSVEERIYRFETSVHPVEENYPS